MENLNCQLCPLTLVLLTQTKNQKYCKPTLLPIPEYLQKIKSHLDQDNQGA